MLVLIVLCVILACAGVWWLVQLYLCERKCAAVASVPGALPIIGHALQLVGDSKHFFNFIINVSKHANDNGGISKIWLGPTRYFLVTDPEISLRLMNTCLGKNYFYKFPAAWLGQGILTADTLTWKAHRKLLNSSFNQNVLDGFLVVFNRQSRELAATLESKMGDGEFDISHILISNSLESVCQTVMGLPLKEGAKVVDKDYAAAVDKMIGSIIYRVQRMWMHLDFVFNQTMMKKQQDEALVILKSTSYNVLQKRKSLINEENKMNREEKGTGKGKFKAFLDQLLELNTEGTFTDHQVREEVDTMIVTAYDTTANSILYLLICMGTHKDMQDRIYQELEDVFGDSDRDVSRHDLNKLVYMDAFIKETMRMYPLAPAFVRHIHCDVEFDGFTLPAGSNFFLLVYGIHHNKCWGDPEIFRPERWLNPEELPKEAGAYAAFGLGRRACIGQAYAMLSIKTSLVHLLRRYKFSGNRHNLQFQFEMVSKPISGHLISIEHR